MPHRGTRVPKPILDTLSEGLTRRLAGFSSRRSFLSRLGTVMVAAPALPLLPVARASAATKPSEGVTEFERHAQATNLRVEQVARERLGMRLISPAVVASGVAP